MGAERRQNPRLKLDLPSALEITVRRDGEPARRVVGKLVDVSVGGFGVETFAELKPGETVELRGRFRSKGLAVRISGTAVVAQSRRVRPDIYHVGLDTKEVQLNHAA